MIPYNDDTRQTYVARCKANHLAAAELYPEDNRSMWLQLLYYAMAEDVYGEHWDKLNSTKGENNG